jgi:hypothetical protein
MTNKEIAQIILDINPDCQAYCYNPITNSMVLATTVIIGHPGWFLVDQSHLDLLLSTGLKSSFNNIYE